MFNMHFHFRKTLYIYICIFALLALFWTISTPVMAYSRLKMLCLVNKERSMRGLRPLGAAAVLDIAAQRHSEDQARMNVMSHTGSDGSDVGTRIKRAGGSYRRWAENVAYGYRDEEACMEGWMRSPGHRANILKADITLMGSGFAYSSSKTPFYTQNFAGDDQKYNFVICPSVYTYNTGQSVPRPAPAPTKQPTNPNTTERQPATTKVTTRPQNTIQVGWDGIQQDIFQNLLIDCSVGQENRVLPKGWHCVNGQLVTDVPAGVLENDETSYAENLSSGAARQYSHISTWLLVICGALLWTVSY
jgi:hypothetical protein